MSDELEMLYQHLHRLTDEDAWALADQWQRVDAEARRQAWVKAKAAIGANRQTRQLDDARREVGEWMRADRTDFAGIEGLLGRAGQQTSGRQAAAPAILDAAAALLARDDLDDEDFDVLTRPWRSLYER